jgi:hypothetical protein
MLLFLSVLSISEEPESFYAIDLGSQFTKLSVVSNETASRLFWNGRDVIPTSIALKTRTKNWAHLASTAFAETEVMIGSTAVSYIHRNPKVGCEFPVLACARDGSEYETSRLLKPIEYLALFAWQLLSHFPPPTAVALTFPIVYTGFQTTCLSNAFRLAGIPILGVYDDFTVLSTFYMDYFFPRILTKPEYHVMFIDVGASFFKCFAVNFTFLENSTEAQLLGLEFSEAASGSALVRALAKHTRLSVGEAQKLLKDAGETRDFAKAELNEMRKALLLLLNIIGPVDEFQIYGGASQLKFVYEMIDGFIQDHFTPLNASHLLNAGLPVPKERHVLTDLDPNHAIADATVHMVRRSRNYTEGIPVSHSSKPVWTYYVDWGTQTEKYCQKNFVCRYPNFEFRLESNEMVIRADPRQLQRNSSAIVNRYRLKNLTNVTFDAARPGRLYVQLAAPEPVFQYVLYSNGSDLVPIEFAPMPVNPEELEKTTAYFKDVIEEMYQVRLKDEKLALVREAVEKMEARVRASSDKPEVSKQILEQLEEYKTKLADGTYRRMRQSQLKRVLDEIGIVATVLGFDVK